MAPMATRIHTPRLTLRPCAAEDVDALHRLWTEPSVRRYLWDDQVISRERAAEVVRDSVACFAHRGFGQWLVLAGEGEPLIGFCGLRPFGEPPQIEILYGLAPEHRGRGLATEAARAVLRYGFEELDFERLFAGADPPNAASFRVMERLGMKPVGAIAGAPADAVYYSISREAFRHRDAP